MSEPDLIFLVGQPRSGSTLAQRILAGHPSIMSCSEPWLMFFASQPLSTASPGASINEQLAKTSLNELSKLLPNGRTDLIEAVRAGYGRLYSLILKDRPESIFLDKTPRYYLIVPELHEIFPSAKIVVLLRNPMAVMASNLTTWAKPGLGGLWPWRDDLKLAPRLLADSLDSSLPNLYKLRYEDLVSHPESSMKQLCEWLGVPYKPEMLNYGDQEEWLFGDEILSGDKKFVQSSFADKWKTALRNPRYWRLFREYADYLGRDLYERLGYDWDALDQLLSANRPPFLKRKISISLHSVLANPKLRRKPKMVLADWKSRLYGLT